MNITRVEAGYVPSSMVLVVKTDEPVYEYDPTPYTISTGGYVSYYSLRSTTVYEAGRLVPIECFENGILVGHGETFLYEDEEEQEFYTIRNEWGRAVNEDDEEEYES